MKTVLVALALVGLTAVAAIDRDSNLLASQTGDRKRISSSRLNALQALGVGLDNSASAQVHSSSLNSLCHVVDRGNHSLLA